MTNAKQVRRIGSIAIDLSSGEVQKNGRKLKLQEQPFQVLAALVERPGEVVSREELRQRVWPDNTFVDFNNGLNIAIVKLRQALNDDATKPRYIETLPRRGYRLIAPLDEAPGETPSEGPAASAPSEPSVSAAAPLEHTRSVVALGAMAAATVAVLGLVWMQFIPSAGRASAAITLRPSAAVVGFRNLGADRAEDWLSTALGEMLSTELAAGDRLRTIPGESVARARTDLALPDADSYSAATLSRIFKNLGAEYVVVGSYLKAGGQAGAALRVDLRLQDTRSGETVATISETGSSQNLADLVSRAGLALRQKLNLAATGQSETSGVRAALPQNPDTTRLYAEGLNLLRHFDAAGARALLEQVVAADPGYALAYAALARTWTASGYGERARQAARRAWELSQNLPWADRLSIEGAYRQTNGEWDKAARIFEQLRNLYPDNLDYGLQRASAQVKAGRGNQALRTIDELRQLPSPLRDDPAIDLAQSLAAEQTGDFSQSRTVAAKAAGGGQARGSRMLVADARAQECRMLRSLGRLDDARAACETARQIYAARGDREGAATITGYLAAIRADEGDLGAAQELYASALATDREIGNEGGAIWELNGLADVLWSRGDLSGALKRFEESLEAARRTASRADETDALDNIAVISLLRGDLARARQMFEQAVEQFRAMGDKSGLGNALGNLGETLYLQGDLPMAAQDLEQAVRINRGAGNTAETADVLAWSGRVLMAQGDQTAARRRFDESLKVWSEMGSPGYLARHRLLYAELAIEGGRPAEAETPIREGLPVFEKEKLRDVEVEARTLLARALLDEGKPTEARREIEQMRAPARSTQNLMVRMTFDTVAAETMAASGKPSDAVQAVRRLQQVTADASSRGFLEYRLRARLALGKAEIRAGRTEAGRADLKALEQEARARGFGTIARRAAAVQAQSGVRP